MTHKNPYLLFLGIALGPFMVGIDMLAIGVAVEPMIRALGISIVTLQWFITAFAIGNSSFQVSSGKFADLFGLKRIFILGFVFFTLSSLLIALTSSPLLITILRLIQGASGGVLPTIGIAIFITVYPPEKRAKWIAGLVGLGGLGMVLGPTVGGYLIHHFSWRSIFLINVPIGAIAILLNLLYVPKLPLRGTPGEKIDWKGMIFFTSSLILFTVGVSQGHYWGWFSAKTILVFVGTAILVALFLFFEKRTKQPLIEFALFKVKNFFASNIAGLILYFTLTAWILIFGLYLQKVVGMTAQMAGVSLLPFGLVAAIVSTQMGKIVKRFGPKRVIITGFICATLAFTGMSLMPILPPQVLLWLWFGLFGLGFVLVNSSSIPAALEYIPVEKAGIASAKSMMMRWLGGALGSAIMATLLISHSWTYLQKKSSSITSLATPQAQQLLHDVITADSSKSSLGTTPGIDHLINQSYHHGLIVCMIVLSVLSFAALLISQIYLKEKSA
jgi:DHA2 family methylenomycin A resistance protein-like MFS transporter